MTGEHDEYERNESDVRGQIEVECACGCRFMVPNSMKAGLANCPQCHKATPVPGGPEPLFWFLLGGGILLALILTVAIGSVYGLDAGGITLGVCALVITILVLAS